MMLITTLVVSFLKGGRRSVNVELWFLVVYVQCEVLCRLVVLDQLCYNLQPGRYSSLQQPKVCTISDSQY